MEPEKTSPSHATEQTGIVAREKGASILQPDTLLQAQFFGDRRRQAAIEPEMRLMLAILEDAVQCFQDNCASPCNRSKQPFEDAQRWIFDAGGDWVFGFDNICGVLGFNPDYIRKGLMRWRDEELSKHRDVPFARRQFEFARISERRKIPR